MDFTTVRKEAHIHSVGLISVRTLRGLNILNIFENKIHISDIVKEEMSLLRTELKVAISLQFPYSITDKCHKIAFPNVTSLHKDIEDVKSDYTLMACAVQMFCETSGMN